MTRVRTFRYGVSAALLALTAPLVASTAATASPPPETAWTQRYEVGGNDALASISCPTTKVCVSVGNETATTLNGGATWIRSSLLPAVGQLGPISCPSASFCLSGGGYAFPTNDLESMWVSGNQGRSWHQATQNVTQGTGSLSLSCANASLCLGSWQGGNTSFIQSTNAGRSWTSPALPSPGRALQSSSMSVACPTVAMCLVAGLATTPSGSADVVMWKRVGSAYHRVFTAAGLNDTVFASCSAAGSCGVVQSGRKHVYFSNDGGTTWTMSLLPTLATSSTGIDCSGHTCIVLARRADAMPLFALTTTDNGATWRSAIVAPAFAAGSAPSVSCPGATSCDVVDGFFPGGDVAQGTGTHMRWTLRRVATGPDPLRAVSCASPTTCVAVGGADLLRSVDDGTEWSRPSAAVPAGTSFASVACPTTTTCAAVGANGTKGAILRSTDGGMTWSLVTGIPVSGPLTRVACASAAFCVAVGPPTEVLLSTDAGATWSAKPYPTSWSKPSISDISCIPTTCLAVGTNASTTALDISIAVGGATWSDVTFSTFSQPSSVSCETGSDCWAVGIYQNEGPDGLIPGVYATTDGGATWTLASQPPTGQPGLIECASTVCQNVGTGSFRFPVVDQIATSNDGGGTWTVDAVPSTVTSIQGLVLNAGSWIGVGMNALGGPEIISSP